METATARCVDLEMEDALFLVIEEAVHLPFMAAKRHELWRATASVGAANPYQSMMDIIDHAVAALIKARQGTEIMARHKHELDPEDGCCGVCGVDGKS